jgi:DNA repair protein RecO
MAMTQMQAVVLTVQYQMERDIRVELLTSEYGRIRAFVRYAQTKRPRWGGLLQAWTLLSLAIHATTTTYSIRNAQLITGFNHMKQSYSRIMMAYRLGSIIRAMSPLGYPNPHMFSIVEGALQHLNASTHVDPDFLESVMRDMAVSEGIYAPDNPIPNQQMYRVIESYTDRPVIESL